RPGIEKMLAKWRDFDQCPDQPRVSPTLSGKPGTPDQGHTATKYAWGPCNHDTEVVLWKLTGSGHVWPGGFHDALPHVLGSGTSLIDANEEMWHFFKQFKLPAQ